MCVAGSSGRDVVIEAEQVARIVECFDVRKAAETGIRVGRVDIVIRR